MSDPNQFLISALKYLKIPIENYHKDPKFEALPSARDSSFWNFTNPPFGLNVFELGALQNARCGHDSQ